MSEELDPRFVAVADALAQTTAEPALVLQGNPRLVVTANHAAQRLFDKEQNGVAGRRGGQVFDCLHSFSEAGCGKDANCEPCRIRLAIVDTLDTGTAHRGVSTVLPVVKADETKHYRLTVSTEKAGDLALVKVEKYEHEH